MSLGDLLRKAGIDPPEFLRGALEETFQALMEAAVDGRVGADRYERTADRATYRHGHRERAWNTRLGSVQRQIPQRRPGSYFPDFLEPRRRSEQALTAVIQEAYVSERGEPADGGRARPGLGDDRAQAVGGVRRVRGAG